MSTLVDCESIASDLSHSFVNGNLSAALESIESLSSTIAAAVVALMIQQMTGSQGADLTARLVRRAEAIPVD